VSISGLLERKASVKIEVEKFPLYLKEMDFQYTIGSNESLTF
jgi:hypothetical protein